MKNYNLLIIWICCFQGLTISAQTPCINGTAAGYPCEKVDLLSFLSLSDLGGTNEANDIWGWTDSASGREFAIMGRSDGTEFVEITDPVNPIHIGVLPTQTSNSSWRDIKTYADHAFIVSEAGSHGMQVFDLSQLLTVTNGPITFSISANSVHYDDFGSAHNIVINEDSGFAFAVGAGSCSGGLHMIDISTPSNPTFAGCFSADGYTHDAQCVIYDGPDTQHVGKEICFNYNEDELTIVDVSDKSNPIILSTSGYAGRSYTHQGWLTEDHRYALMDDELDEQNTGANTETFVWDLVDLDAPIMVGSHFGTTTAIDHNQYTLGNYTYQANYRAGLQILELTDLTSAALTQVAHFDIFPTSNSNAFNGAWSVYPYFPSGTIVVSGIEQGLFVLKANLVPVIPTAAFSPGSGNQSFCPDATGNAQISFSDQSLDGPTSWTWTFSGTANPSITSSTVQNPVVTVTNSGNLDVSLQVGNVAGNSAVVTENLQVMIYASCTQTCQTFTNDNLGIAISSSGSNGTYANSISVSGLAGSITDVNVNNVNIDHTYSGDLEIDLTSPDGTEISLVDNQCGGDNDINIGFDDEAGGIPPCPMTTGLMYLPNGALSDFDDASANGNWTMDIADTANADGGTWNSWEIEICTLEPVMAACTIDLVTVSNIVCSNNSTPSDPTDDTYSFDLTVSATGGDPAGFSANNGITGGAYGVTISQGPFSISNGDISFDVIDNGDNSCMNTQTVIAPQTCSNIHPCSNTEVLTGTENGVLDIEATWIESDQTIGAAAKVDYDATDFILMKSGFITLLGAEFEAFIDGCNGGEGGGNFNQNPNKFRNDNK